MREASPPHHHDDKVIRTSGLSINSSLSHLRTRLEHDEVLDLGQQLGVPLGTCVWSSGFRIWFRVWG